MILDILPYFWGSSGCMISNFANPDMLLVIIFWIIYIFNQYLGFSGNEATIFYNEANKSYTLYQNFNFTFYLYLTLAFFVIILNIYIIIKLLRELKRKKEIKKI